MHRSLVCAMVLLVGACGSQGGGEIPDGGGETPNALVVTPAGPLELPEGNDDGTIGVALAAAPDHPVTVAIAAAPLVTADPSTLTFTADDFDTPQEVRFTTLRDPDVIDGAGEIVLSAPEVDTVTIPVAIRDGDVVGVVVTPSYFVVMEDGSATLAVALAADPGGPVSIAIASSDPAVATVAPATVDFTADDWAVPRTVTVSGVHDADALDSSVALDVSGLETSTASWPFEVYDVDAVNLVISPGALALTEGGPDGTFTVRLTQPPDGSFAVAVYHQSPFATATPSSLTFTAADFDVPQTVVVSPRVDLDAAIGHSAVELRGDDLDERIVNLSVAEDGVADVPDAGAEFLLTIRPDLPEDRLIRYRVAYQVDPDTWRLSYTAVALQVDDGQPVGDPIAAGPFVVGYDHSFAATFAGVLPGAANSISGSNVTFDATMSGALIDKDFLCGTFSGTVGPLPLAGSTWAAVRITAATLPDPEWTCRP